MSDRFDRAFALLQVHEGGFVDHPADPGGATNKGVTQRTYDAWRQRKGLPQRSVRLILDDEVRAIYRRQYWDTIRADDMPEGVAYCVFDAAVNSGPARAVRWAQEVAGAVVDGIVGEETLAKLEAARPIPFIDAYCDKRLAFMKSLRHWKHFGEGWTRRVSEVRETAKDWAALGTPTPLADMPEAEPTPPAKGPQKPTETLKDRRLWEVLAPFGGSLTALASGDGPVQFAIAAVLVLVAATFLVLMLRRDA